MSEFRLTPDEFKEAVQAYVGWFKASQVELGGFPKVPADAESFIGWRVPLAGDWFLSVTGKCESANASVISATKKLIVKMSTKKYRYVCTDTEFRPAVKGDFIYNIHSCGDGSDTFIEIAREKQPGRYLIFRREEIQQ